MIFSDLVDLGVNKLYNNWGNGAESIFFYVQKF